MAQGRALAVTMLVAVLAAACATGAGDDVDAPVAPEPSTSVRRPRRLLVFSRTTGFRHASIPTAIAAIRDLAGEGRYAVDATEDPAVFNAANLSRYGAIVFLLTSGDVLDPAQQQAFERHVSDGGGFVGVHSATDTEYDWPFYTRVVGAQFAAHPAPAPATIVVEDGTHLSTTHLPERWTRTDEWYDFRANPRPSTHVLLRLDEATYAGGGMGADHPISWCHDVGAGRAWYTGLGHADEAYAEPLFRQHLLGGIRYALGEPSDCG